MPATLDQISNQLSRLERKYDLLIEQRRKPRWVKSTAIIELTGWTKEKMRQARENGYITFETRDDANGKLSYWYDLNTLSEKFIKN